jgi:hypothetical protein
MPTGWRSEYLGENQFLHRKQAALLPAWPRIPGCNLEGRAEDLCSYEFRHVDEIVVLTAGAISGQKWRDVGEGEVCLVNGRTVGRWLSKIGGKSPSLEGGKQGFSGSWLE